MKKLTTLIFYYCILAPFSLWAEDTIRLTVRDSASDIYQGHIVEAALKKSVEKFGSYKLVINHVQISSKRSYQELNNGADDILNIRIGLATSDREKNSIPVPIPIYKGLQSYRLMLVRKGDTDRFKQIANIRSLKSFSIGLLYDWVTTDIMYKNDFHVIESSTYTGLFKMLAAERFDYTILGVNKIYEGMRTSPEIFNKLEIVPEIALYINAPSYIFVSKKHPNIAKRILWGMERMIESGEFDKIFTEHYQGPINKAQLSTRKLIHVPNDDLPKSVPLERKNLWLSR